MNSTLQCLRHFTPLSRYFLSHTYQSDLNPSNPLGTGGKLATAYAELLKELCMRNIASNFSPTALKRAIAMFAPRFAGCLQHDAMEFLAYLLDGLHEDLNRIREAPYVELPEVTGGCNMAVAGAQAWEAHLQRNDSFVLETLYGQFQSTCICPQCHRVSVSFDAFNHVSLEIPQPKRTTKSVAVLLFRQPMMSEATDAPPLQHIQPHRYGVTMNSNCSIADLKLALGNLAGIPATNLILAVICENAIDDIMTDDAKEISTIGSNELIAAYETNSTLEPPEQRPNVVVLGLATQFLIIRTKEGKLGRAKFGFPLVVALDPQASCRDMWNRLWLQVDAMVRQPGARRHIDFVDDQGQVRRHDLLAIRVVSSQGRPLPIFSTVDGMSSSLLPHDSDETMLGAMRGFQGQFICLALEWRNPDDDEVASLPIVRPKSFLAYKEHPSLLEMVEREQTNKMRQRNVTLDQCFEMFTRPERLDENNLWYCSQCNEHVRAMKTMKLWRLPNILIVHLKRFEVKNAVRQDKLDTMVEFPLDGLDMAIHCCGPIVAHQGGSSTGTGTLVDASFGAKYDLFGVVNHYGRMGFGHYTAFCIPWDEDGQSGRWHLYDDSKVQPADPMDVSSPGAYILFYRRQHFH